VILRDAAAADAPLVAGLLAASWQDAYRDLLPAALLADVSRRALAEWQTILAAPPPGFVLIADCPDPMGFAAVWLRGEEAYLDSLHVAPAGRGGGVGRRLLGEAMRRASLAGARHAALRLIEGNEGAMRFYGRLGGRAVALEQADIHGHAVSLRRLRFDDVAALVAACGAG
jgi:GNAT superfamily N-acetyltransferase